ncbi:hypothetical protein CANARDRAFT_26369 [[Candida] arabinofermentans NRRL YB-2248]|uniref:Uncharacterized protein n=1 Tax=[Candida] arabinofermentans NRRL YB-2248 TaxID=983967 RepID=A0A1E4T908_9ASCO|nr:hypothetical protein CANARDRAFT_26369 [[Candida] arabinofermentans NRRL YB-2248]
MKKCMKPYDHKIRYIDAAKNSEDWKHKITTYSRTAKCLESLKECRKVLNVDRIFKRRGSLGKLTYPKIVHHHDATSAHLKVTNLSIKFHY